MADLRPFLCLQITDNVKIFLEGGPKAMADLRPFLCLQIIDNVKISLEGGPKAMADLRPFYVYKSLITSKGYSSSKNIIFSNTVPAANMQTALI